ncbi:nitrogen regulation protein NR(II) [Erythrobacter sp. R86502]|uniref:two-component system sensor histidine kinase NtrB n=1 Tax=Erythrobacter sp. R86502 TaxID=3093846 RepID=UPI0036D3D293
MVNHRPDAHAQIAGLIFAVVLIDSRGVIAEVNHAAEDLLGTSASRLIGTRLVERIGPLDPRVEARLVASDEALVARDLIIAIGTTQARVNLTASPLSSYSGWRVVTLSQIGHEEASPGGDALLGAPAVLAHEIKNPLAAIRGAAQLAARKLAHGDKKLARMITDEVDRIARLIDRMQQLGSTRTGPVEACNPHEAIRAAIATMRAAGSAVGEIEIREEFDPSLPPVLANRDALEQVLINLISNARDAALGHHGAGGQSSVIVQTRFVSGLAFSPIRSGRAVPLPIEITISDNGSGIDPALQGHVFEPFVSSKPAGQGLGLSLVRKLVRDMNGNVSHDRDAHTGLTHFRLHLPQAQDIV